MGRQKHGGEKASILEEGGQQGVANGEVGKEKREPRDR